MSDPGIELIRELYRQLPTLRESERIECLAWMTEVEAKVTQALGRVDQDFANEWALHWKENQPDAVAVSLAEDSAEYEYEHVAKADLDISLDEAIDWLDDQLANFGAFSCGVLADDLYYPGLPGLDFGEKNAAVTDHLIGVPFWGHRGTEVSYARFHWMRKCWDLLEVAHARLARANVGVGEKEESPAVEFPEEEIRLDPLFAEGCDARLRRVVRSRWYAAERLRKSGFYAEAIIFYGCIIEAIMVHYVTEALSRDEWGKYAPKENPSAPPNRWHKGQLYAALRDLGVQHEILDRLSKLATDFRNAIHIHSEKAVERDLHRQANKETSDIIRSCLKLLLEEIRDKLMIPPRNE
ncbi:MAG: hypothetical protein KatS3mg015_1759 [Fimbriimonadales bacterium]|nr:MAG: hypothetical protein KatS3mg015_1759 [Fimbriimonadales bacterium]